MTMKFQSGRTRKFYEISEKEQAKTTIYRPPSLQRFRLWEGRPSEAGQVVSRITNSGSTVCLS